MSITQNELPYIALIFSVLFSFIAIIFNLYLFKEKKEHDVLINTPFFDVEFNADVKTGEFSIYLSNNGLGPGLIKSIIYEHDGSRFSHFKHFLDNEFAQLDSRLGNQQRVSFISPRSVVVKPGYCLAEKSNFLLGSVDVSSKNTVHKREVLMSLKDVSVLVVFTDIFMNEYSIRESTWVN
jgi:hypothetical protein